MCLLSTPCKTALNTWLLATKKTNPDTVRGCVTAAHHSSLTQTPILHLSNVTSAQGPTQRPHPGDFLPSPLSGWLSCVAVCGRCPALRSFPHEHSCQSTPKMKSRVCPCHLTATSFSLVSSRTLQLATDYYSPPFH